MWLISLNEREDGQKRKKKQQNHRRQTTRRTIDLRPLSDQYQAS